MRTTAITIFLLTASCWRAPMFAQVTDSASEAELRAVMAEQRKANVEGDAAMKAGAVGLTRGIAVQYGPEGIRANAICPGLVDGDQTRQVIAQFAPNVEQWMREFVRRHQPLPRLIQPEDIGGVVAFLASEDSGAVTGAEIPVVAGMWAQLVSRD